MSETLVIRDVQGSVVEWLRARASVRNRTIEQEVLAIIEKEMPKVGSFDRVASAAAIKAMTPKGVQQTDSLEMLRQDRARDDVGE